MFDGFHMEFNRQYGVAWDRAIRHNNNVSITIEGPTAAILDGLIKKNRRAMAPSKKTASANTNAAPASLLFGLNEIYKLSSILAPFRPLYPSPERGQNLEQSASQMASKPSRSSPVHPDSDIEEEVGNYITYMSRKYPKQEEGWRNAKEKLLDESLDLRQIRTMNNQEFKDIGIPLGIGMKLRDEVKNFKATRAGYD